MAPATPWGVVITSMVIPFTIFVADNVTTDA